MFEQYKQMFGLGSLAGIQQAQYQPSQGTPSPRLTRKRYKEILEIAESVITMIESKGIKKEEGCTFQTICINLWNMEGENIDNAK